MQDAPDKVVLLQAMARFLAKEVVPAISDPALAFRVRISAHTLGGIAREVQGEVRLDHGELAALTGEAPDLLDPEVTRARIRQARAELVDRIRDPATPQAELAQHRAVMRRLEGAKAVLGQPRFDLSDRIEP